MQRNLRARLSCRAALIALQIYIKSVRLCTSRINKSFFPLRKFTAYFRITTTMEWKFTLLQGWRGWKMLVGLYKNIFYTFAIEKNIDNMGTVIKQKNIDLPIEVLQKLSIMAVAQGRSLQSYIETILIAKANSFSVNLVENPSPSGDEWFLNEENRKMLDKGVEEAKHGKAKAYTMNELKNILGV